MNWVAVAITDLREYKKRKRFLENVDSQLIWLENDFAALKGCATDSEAVDGGASKNEDHLLSNIVRRDKLKQNKKMAQEFIEQIDKTLSLMSKQQQDILTEFFIDKKYGHVQRLMERYHIEQSRVYQLKNEAIRDFTMLRSGYILT